MSKIVNEARIKNPVIVKIRELLEHRAFWLYLLTDEAEKRGLDPKDFASAAVTRCGISQGTELPKAIVKGDDICALRYIKNDGDR